MTDRAYYVTAFCVVCYTVPWAIAFSVERASTNSEECKGPAWFWTNVGLIDFIWSALAAIAYILLKWFEDRISMSIARVAMSIIFFPLLAIGPVTIGLTIAFARRAECPALEGLLSTWFILTMIVLSVPYLIMTLAYYIGTVAHQSSNFGPTLKKNLQEKQDKAIVELKERLNQ